MFTRCRQTILIGAITCFAAAPAIGAENELTYASSAISMDDKPLQAVNYWRYRYPHDWYDYPYADRYYYWHRHYYPYHRYHYYRYYHYYPRPRYHYHHHHPHHGGEVQLGPFRFYWH